VIGNWIAQNPGETVGIIATCGVPAGWIVRNWIIGWADKKYAPKEPDQTAEEKVLELESLARSVLSTHIITEFAESTVTSEYRNARFFEAVEGVVIRSKAVQEFTDKRCQHANTSHESAIRIIISDATKAVGDQLQKSLTDSQAMFMAELRGMRSDMAENMKAISEHVGELDTALQVHKAHDDAKRA
jgi:hypothetical protein